MSSIVNAILAKIDAKDYYGRYTDLKQEGSRWRGVCPICKGNNESEFAVFPDGKYHCFRCLSSGTVIDFTTDLNKFGYNYAVEKLAEELNLDITRDTEYISQVEQINKNETIANNYAKQVSSMYSYLVNERGLTEEQVLDYKLGANNNNLVIPLRDRNGRTIAFAFRQFEVGKAKYINSKNSNIYDKSKYLYNLDKASKVLRDKLVLVEGYFDAIAGQTQLPTVAYCGIEISKNQIIEMKEIASSNPYFEVLWLPDNDGKAIKVIPKIRERFLAIAPNMNVNVGIMPDGVKDLSDYIATGGKIDDLKTESLDMYVLKLMLDKCTNRNMEYGIVEDYKKTINSPMIKSDIGRYLAERWGKDLKEVRELLDIKKSSSDLMGEFKSPAQCITEYGQLLNSKPIGFGFPNLDKALRGGSREQDVCFIGAYSSVGKTMVAVQMITDMILRQNKKVLFFSLEMTAGALYERVLANMLGKSTLELEKMMNSQDPSIHGTVEKLKQRLFIIDTNHLSVEDIEERIKIANTRLIDEGRIDVVVVDYLQYMAGTDDYEKLSKTVRHFKPIAKEQGIMFVVLSQLNRSAMAWETPTMNMLKGAGDIEATGDIILFLHKPSLNPKLTAIEREQIKNTIVLTVGKARRGCMAYEFELEFVPNETKVKEIM